MVNKLIEQTKITSAPVHSVIRDDDKWGSVLTNFFLPHLVKREAISNDISNVFLVLTVQQSFWRKCSWDFNLHVAIASAVTAPFSHGLSSEWVLGSRRLPGHSKTEVNCVTNNMREMSELGERPGLVEMSYISLNHTNCLSSSRPEEVVVTIDETLQQQPPDTYSGT